MAKETTHKIEVNWNAINNNENEINNIPKININKNPVLSFKQQNEVVMAENRLMTAAEFVEVEYDIYDMPEWAIPHMKLFSWLETEDNFTETFVPLHTNFIVQISGTLTKFIYFFRLLYGTAPYYAPIYLNAKLVFINPRLFNVIQHNKS